jgi:aerobic-type carbon monoxide dehydrogenase small subunit (CoxS/CutS family)
MFEFGLFCGFCIGVFVMLMVHLATGGPRED